MQAIGWVSKRTALQSDVCVVVASVLQYASGLYARKGSALGVQGKKRCPSRAERTAFVVQMR